MNLPFEIPNKHKRKYQCFICGREYEEFPKFKEHIIESHEEGTDYVRCPLGRCQAPVRDVKLHFKARHPSEKKLPKGTYPLKATIWRDIKKGKIKKRKPNFITGSYTSTKTGKTFTYRSRMEESVYEQLDMDHSVLDYEAEPFAIDYIFKGEAHKYTPDILVLFEDGHRELWEIKPSSQTTLPQNQAKWHAAQQACDLRGWKFETITEKYIDKLKKKIKFQQTAE